MGENHPIEGEGRKGLTPSGKKFFKEEKNEILDEAGERGEN